jgi:hypothetical protein
MNIPKTLSLSAKIDQRRVEKLNRLPESSRLLWTRCWSGKASPRQAIKAFCQECIGFERAAITDCRSFDCPLWNLRPYQPKPELEEVEA